MARQLIATQLIKSVRDRAMIPDDTSVYDDQSILNILNEEIDVGLLDTLLTLKEEHLVTYTDVVATQQGNTSSIIIPSRSVASKLRAVQRIEGGNVFEMGRIDLGELADYSNGYSSSGRDLFYVRGDEIIFITPSTSMLRLYFHLRPNVITLESTSAQISGIDRTTGIIQFSTIPKEFVSLTSLDFVQNKSPNKILAFDIPSVSVSISTRSLTMDANNIPSRLSVGDWVCFPETSPYANVPTEMHPLLAQRAAIYILEAMGDNDNLTTAVGKLKQMEKSIQKILDDRVEGSPRKIKSRHGFLGNGAGYSSNRNRRGNY